MFIVYSPEGQSSIGASPIVPQLKIDPSKKVIPVGESEMDELHPDAEGGSKEPMNSAVRQYQDTMDTTHDRRQVVMANEIMSSPVLTVSPTLSLVDCWQMMIQAKVHHLPVLQTTGQLIGLVTVYDLLTRTVVGFDGQLEEVKQETVEDIMQKEVVTTFPSTDIRQVAEVMSQYHISCVPVMTESNILTGVITLSDLVKRLANKPPLTLYA